MVRKVKGGIGRGLDGREGFSEGAGGGVDKVEH